MSFLEPGLREVDSNIQIADLMFIAYKHVQDALCGNHCESERYFGGWLVLYIVRATKTGDWIEFCFSNLYKIHNDNNNIFAERRRIVFFSCIVSTQYTSWNGEHGGMNSSVQEYYESAGSALNLPTLGASLMTSATISDLNVLCLDIVKLSLLFLTLKHRSLDVQNGRFQSMRVGDLENVLQVKIDR